VAPDLVSATNPVRGEFLDPNMVTEVGSEEQDRLGDSHTASCTVSGGGGSPPEISTLTALRGVTSGKGCLKTTPTAVAAAGVNTTASCKIGSLGDRKAMMPGRDGDSTPLPRLTRARVTRHGGEPDARGHDTPTLCETGSRGDWEAPVFGMAADSTPLPRLPRAWMTRPGEESEVRGPVPTAAGAVLGKATSETRPRASLGLRETGLWSDEVPPIGHSITPEGELNALRRRSAMLAGQDARGVSKEPHELLAKVHAEDRLERSPRKPVVDPRLLSDPIKEREQRSALPADLSKIADEAAARHLRREWNAEIQRRSDELSRERERLEAEEARLEVQKMLESSEEARQRVLSAMDMSGGPTPGGANGTRHALEAIAKGRNSLGHEARQTNRNGSARPLWLLTKPLRKETPPPRPYREATQGWASVVRGRMPESQGGWHGEFRPERSPPPSPPGSPPGAGGEGSWTALATVPSMSSPPPSPSGKAESAEIEGLATERHPNTNDGPPSPLDETEGAEAEDGTAERIPNTTDGTSTCEGNLPEHRSAQGGPLFEPTGLEEGEIHEPAEATLPSVGDTSDADESTDARGLLWLPTCADSAVQCPGKRYR